MHLQLAAIGASEYHIVEQTYYLRRFSMDSNQILDREFLDIRAKILEVAAALDRIDRAEGNVASDSRMHLLSEAIAIIAAEQSDPIRAEKVQLLFSREYDDKWLEEFGMTSRT